MAYDFTQTFPFSILATDMKDLGLIPASVITFHWYSSWLKFLEPSLQDSGVVTKHAYPGFGT